MNLWRIYQGAGLMGAVYKRALKSFLQEIILGGHFTDHGFSEPPVTPVSMPLPGKHR